MKFLERENSESGFLAMIHF